MHPDFARADRLSPNVIGAAIEVHRDKGPGLLEEIYKRCLMHELALRRIPALRELVVPIAY
jgi:GxxExxY protein